MSGPHRWGKQQRLLRRADFERFVTDKASWRAARTWLAVSVRLLSEGSLPLGDAAPAVKSLLVPGAQSGLATSGDPSSAQPLLRFGITVSRRQARRAVVRNAVRRIVREAARHAAPALVASLSGRRLDVLLRLKAPLPPMHRAGWTGVMHGLRREADSLLRQLQEQIDRGAVVLAQSGPVSPQPQGLPQGKLSLDARPAGLGFRGSSPLSSLPLGSVPQRLPGRRRTTDALTFLAPGRASALGA